MPSFHMFGNEFDAMLELILYTLLSLFLYMCVCVCVRALSHNLSYRNTFTISATDY